MTRYISVRIMRHPSIDIGFLISDNFRTYDLSLIFFELLINLKTGSVALGIGVPFWKAIAVFIHNKSGNQ